ncbi:hypothetical protein ACFVWG_05830 [Kribbella sp. NPDC058245]|uniref:hypothetical protein n=1 Tax=Kribbella sp. NPDC058245 TaxID=3346399 RepID=UPI0036F0DCA5
MREGAVRVAAVVVFAYGTAVHAYDLLRGGLDAYAGYPGWLRGFYTALIVLDAACAVLIAMRRRAGLVLGSAVLVADALANGYAVYGLHQGPTIARVGQGVVSALAVAMVLASRWLWRSFR